METVELIVECMGMKEDPLKKILQGRKFLGYDWKKCMF